jgi:hypothetical protein
MTRLIKWVVGGAGALTTAIFVALALPAIASASNYCMITSTNTLRGHAGDTLKVFGNFKAADPSHSFIVLDGEYLYSTTMNRTRAVATVPDWRPGTYSLGMYCSDADGESTYSRQFTILPSP